MHILNGELHYHSLMSKAKTGLQQTSDHFRRIHWRAKIRQYNWRIPFIWLFNSLEDLVKRSVQLLFLFFIVDLTFESIGYAGGIIPISEYDRLAMAIFLGIISFYLIRILLNRILSNNKRSIQISDCIDCSNTGMRSNGICRTCNGLGVVNHSKGI